MIRRRPTRVELKLDDLQEYEMIKKEMEEKKKQHKPVLSASPIVPDTAAAPTTMKDRQEMINERIGYSPKVHIAS